MILSVSIILLLGLVFSKVMDKFRLPGLLGMIILGAIIGPYGMSIIDKSILDNADSIRTMALIIILLRAGLGINKDVLRKVGKSAIKMSIMPCIVEGIFILVSAHFLLDLSLVESGMLAFIIAAVSPAVIVPGMIELQEKGYGTKKGIPTIILAGASIDDIFAITIFTMFLGFGSNSEKNAVVQLLGIPIEIIGGIILGIMVAYILMYIYRKVNLSHLEKLLLLIAAAFLIKILGDFINVSGLLAVMTVGFALLEKARNIAVELETSLNKIWFFAQIFLFVLIGAAVDINVAVDAGLIGVLIILIGLVGRSIGVMFALNGSGLNSKEKLFCAIAYFPKATVQAAMAGVPLSAGIASGNLILALAVVSIILTAPLGAILIKITAPKLLNKDI